MCQKLGSQLRNTLQNGDIAAEMGLFLRLSGSQTTSQLRNGGSCAAKWHSCAILGFAAAKTFAEDRKVLRIDFATKSRFRREFLLGCEISQSSFSPLFLLCFRSDFFPISSFAFSPTWGHSKR